MKTNEIIEGNKLIAEFMELVKNDSNFSSGKSIEYKKGVFVDYKACGEGFLKYDSSWDWLMPVVEKISSLCNPTFEDEINRKRVEIFKKVTVFSSFEWIYDNVIEFIKWYNENK